MTADIEIQCIRKRDRQNPHERIQGVGGLNPDKSRWFLPEEQAIAKIEDHTYRFWTHGGGKSVWVVIATHLGRKYLKTEADGVRPDNLLALPECP